MNLFLGGVGTCMAFFGIFMNLYVIIVLLLNKKARTSSEWILLHLSWCGLGASFFNLCLISPSIFMARWLTSTGSLCSLVGASVLTLQLLTVWSICALSADRCAAIASPLRYTQLVTGRRVAIFFLIIWVLSIGSAMAAFIVSSIKDDSYTNQQYNSNKNSNNSVANSVNGSVISDKNHIVNRNSSYNLTFMSRNFDSSGVRNNPSSSTIPSSIVTSTLANNFGGSTSAFRSSSSIPFGGTTDFEKEISSALSSSSSSSSSSPTAANMIFEFNIKSSGRMTVIKPNKLSASTSTHAKDFQKESETTVNYTSFLSTSQDEHSFEQSETTFSTDKNENSDEGGRDINDYGVKATESVSEFRKAMGLCLPRVYFTSLPSMLWVSEWIFVILVAPLCTILVCDLVVLSIARKQRHRIVMALYQITLSAQATVVRKGTTPPQLWFNRTVPARSRAVRAVFEDFLSLMLIHLPLILILVFEMLADDHHAPVLLHFLGSISLYLSPCFTALLYGIRARSLRAAYKSYIRKRMTNNTLQHEIQQRLSPVDGGSPRPSSGAKSFRSCTPSPASSPIQTPRRLSTNDLRPPPMHFPMNTCSSPVSPLPGPNSSAVINNDGSHFFMEHHNNVLVNNHNNSMTAYTNYDDGDEDDHRHYHHFSSDNGCLGGKIGGGANNSRKIRSFLHLPSGHDMQEFWSGLRRPNRSPTIIITHEIRMKESSNSSYDSKSIVSSPTAEQRL